MAKTYLTGTLPAASFGNIINLVSPAPLDGRAVVDTYSDIQGTNFKTLFVEDGVNTWYLGMLVVTKDTGKVYVLKSETDGFVEISSDSNGDYVSKSELNNYILKSEIGNIFNFSGSFLNVLKVPQASKELVGKVYNIREGFTIEEYILDNEGKPIFNDDGTILSVPHNYSEGTNIVCYEFKYNKPVIDESTGKIALDESGNRIFEEEEQIEYRWDALGGMHGIDWIEVTN